MSRILVAAIALLVAITFYSLFDCMVRDRSLISVLPKWVWALVILFVPILGAILWYLFGRSSFPPKAPGRGGQRAPDDDPEYLRKVADDIADQHRRARRENGETETGQSEHGPGDDGATT